MLHPSIRPAHGLLRSALALALCALPAQAAFALVKCVASDGRVTFQDVMCGIDSTSVSLHRRASAHREPADRPAHEAPQRAKAESTAQATSARPAFGPPGGVTANPLR